MKTENSGKESNNGSILILDLNPDSVICPLMFEPQCSLSSGEEISIGKKHRKRYKEKHLRARILGIASGALVATVKRCQ